MNTTARSLCRLLPILFIGCATIPRAHADIILTSQPTVVNNAAVGLGFYSSSHPRPTRNFKRGDDFTLAADSLVTSIRWWGQSEGRVADDLRNFDQYTIEIFQGVPATGRPLPGALVWSGAFPAASLSITPTGRTSPSSGAAEHLYQATIPNVPLGGGGSYILAISARSINPSSDAWQWQDSEPFGGHGAIFSYASGAWSAFQDTDSSFELRGTPVPTPGAGLAFVLVALPFTTRRVRRA